MEVYWYTGKIVEFKSIPVSGSVSMLSKYCLAERDWKCSIFSKYSLVFLSPLIADLLVSMSQIFCLPTSPNQCTMIQLLFIKGWLIKWCKGLVSFPVQLLFLKSQNLFVRIYLPIPFTWKKPAASSMSGHVQDLHNTSCFFGTSRLKRESLETAWVKGRWERKHLQVLLKSLGGEIIVYVCVC